MKIKRVLAMVLTICLLVATTSFSGCSKSVNFGKIDNSKWKYNKAFNVYYQNEISYCKKPSKKNIQNLSIFVPGEYMAAADNGDGTFTCTINEQAQKGNYVASTAPIVIPVETPGFVQMNPVLEFNAECVKYTDSGFVYVRAGCRGKDAGAPAGVTDLKAAVRYLRYTDKDVAGSTDRIFVFGVSGGGSQAAVLGASGNSDLYKPYLKDIGAVMNESDAVLGVMSWSPVTNPDMADAAYEWNLGCSRVGLSDEDKAISDKLAESYAKYINDIKLKNADGTELTLAPSQSGVYQSGTYYEQIKSVVEGSLNNFLATTTFPIKLEKPKPKANNDTSKDFQDTVSNSEDSSIGIEQDLDEISGDNPVSLPSFDEEDENSTEESTIKLDFDPYNQADIYAVDGVIRGESTNGVNVYGTFENAQQYIDALNKNVDWIEYDKETNTATIISVEDFVAQQKTATKGIGAFDSLDRKQAENILFGSKGNGSHFDSTLYNIVKENSRYAPAFDEDFSLKDSAKSDVAKRVNMYNPMYYINDYYDGYDTAVVAQCWRIRSGIQQSDTALCTEVNLSLALKEYGKDVDFETIWGKGHIMAEQNGTGEENFINWINNSL